MSDIVKELLSRASDQDGIGWTPTTIIPVPARLLHHAADRIEQLEVDQRDTTEEFGRLSHDLGKALLEIERLRAALKMFACECPISERCAVPDNCLNFQARRVLERKP